MVQLATFLGILTVACLVTSMPAEVDIRDVLSARTHPGSQPHSATFTSGIAAGLSACAAGANAGSVDSGSKSELASWCKSSGSSYFSQDVVSDISSWCSGSASKTPKPSTCTGIQSGLKSSHGNQWGSCSMWGWLGSFMDTMSASMVADASTQTSLQAFVGGSGAANVNVNALGALKTCGAGGIAASLSSQAKSDCTTFISKPDCPLTSAVIAGVKAWLEGKAGKDSGQSYCSASQSATLSYTAGVSATAGVSVSASASFSQSVGSPTQPTASTVLAPSPVGASTATSVEFSTSAAVSTDCSCSESETVAPTTSTSVVPVGTNPVPTSSLIPVAPSNNVTVSAGPTSSPVPFTGTAVTQSRGFSSLLLAFFGSIMFMI